MLGRVPKELEEQMLNVIKEDPTWHEEAIPTHEVERTCNRLGIKHTTTKVKHPWTNGYGERLKKTLLDEFYAVSFRKKRYGRIEESVAN
jgi:transposase InsO family protein